MVDYAIYETCFFLHEHVPSMSGSTDYLKDKYCKGNFVECARYLATHAYGPEKVPKYLYPNDLIMAQTSNLPTPLRFSLYGGMTVPVKVIYPDGSFGLVRASSIGKSMRSGEIVAFHFSRGWVEVRRKGTVANYEGPERRKSDPESASLTDEPTL